MRCGRIFVLFMVNVGLVSSQFILVPLRRRMEKCVLGLMKFCIDSKNILKGLNVISSSDQASLDTVNQLLLRH